MARGDAALTRALRLLALAALPLGVVAVFFVLPVGAMLVRGLAPDGQLDPGGLLEVLGRDRTGRVLWFTLWSAALGTLLSLLLGLPVAYVLFRLAVPGARVLRALTLVPFVLPTVVVGAAFRALLGEGGLLAFLGWDGTPAAIVAALVFFNVSVVVRVVGGAWAGLDPRSEQAAAALGASPVRVLLTVTLPALRSALASAAAVVFLFCSTAFGVVLTLGGLRYATVETEIYLLTRAFDLPAAACLSLVQVVTVVALLALLGRLRGRAHGAVPVDRVPPRPRRPRRGDVPALVVTGLVVLATALPIAGLAAASFRVRGAWTLANYRALDEPGVTTALDVPVLTALRNSLQVAVDATWMALLLGLLVALVVTRRARTRPERVVRGLLDGFFMLPLGVSAVVLGFGLLVTVARPPLALRDEPLLVPLVQALVALPLVVRTLVPVLAGIDDRQRQAAASLGASPARTLLVVDLPVVWRPLLAAAGFAFATSLGEFGATSFLSRPDHPTLPVVIGRLLGSPGTTGAQSNPGMAMAAAVVLAATVTVVVLAVERLRVPSVGAV
ncbi:ABC transporter permease [Nocardioides zeae]|uniref:Thiamine transport system permease protein n=1 Tax=Nocardioides zeae TaxID=1457234 RepID=A0AAJ1X1X8_9ACTN|nr:ABC transporter permease subunit [Nocardioides zeae]MDQ1105351.1 thiamine transport system permease protein [Nocardioides zeae]